MAEQLQYLNEVLQYLPEFEGIDNNYVVLGLAAFALGVFVFWCGLKYKESSVILDLRIKKRFEDQDQNQIQQDQRIRFYAQLRGKLWLITLLVNGVLGVVLYLQYESDLQLYARELLANKFFLGCAAADGFLLFTSVWVRFQIRRCE